MFSLRQIVRLKILLLVERLDLGFEIGKMLGHRPDHVHQNLRIHRLDCSFVDPVGNAFYPGVEPCCQGLLELVLNQRGTA